MKVSTLPCFCSMLEMMWRRADMSKQPDDWAETSARCRTRAQLIVPVDTGTKRTSGRLRHLARQRSPFPSARRTSLGHVNHREGGRHVPLFESMGEEQQLIVRRESDLIETPAAGDGWGHL